VVDHANNNYMVPYHVNNTPSKGSGNVIAVADGYTSGFDYGRVAIAPLTWEGVLPQILAGGEYGLTEASRRRSLSPTSRWPARWRRYSSRCLSTPSTRSWSARVS